MKTFKIYGGMAYIGIAQGNDKYEAIDNFLKENPSYSTWIINTFEVANP